MIDGKRGKGRIEVLKSINEDKSYTKSKSKTCVKGPIPSDTILMIVFHNLVAPCTLKGL